MVINKLLTYKILSYFILCYGQIASSNIGNKIEKCLEPIYKYTHFLSIDSWLYVTLKF